MMVLYAFRLVRTTVTEFWIQVRALVRTGSATIYATQWIINASYNQHQRFSPLSPEPQMLGLQSGAPNMYWPHIWWLIQAV
jgi:hypothetical protein